MNRGVLITALLALVVSTVGCEDDGAVGSAEELRDRLAMSVAGDRVCLTDGTFTGPFDVPAGVTLCGAGVDRTRIIAPDTLPGLRLAPGPDATPTTVTGLTVEAHGDFGIRAVGPGAVAVVDAAVEVPRNGAGIGAEMVTSLDITRVNAIGPVTIENAAAMPLEPSIIDSATYGVVAVGVMDVAADDLTVSGFAYCGVLAVNSGFQWATGSVSSTLGTNFLGYGGVVELNNVELTGAIQGPRLIPAYNAVFAGSADVMTNALVTSTSGGYGILQSEATATHDGLMAMDNANAGIWVQNSGGMTIRNATIGNSGTAGVVAVASTEVSLDQIQIMSTRAMTRIVGTMPVEVGDGIQLRGSTTGVSVSNATLDDNARIGLLVDLDGDAFDGISIASTTVSGTGGDFAPGEPQLGAIAQDGTIPVGWDAGITRVPVLQANDLAHIGLLDTVAIVGPSDIPAVTAVLSMGLAGIVGPSD